ncbi:hypothetical protein B7494_g2019 [Chlorociboria aeruginascens]|nr:hypothetical protein B7494_g2019 [Chlorociboria aeruginascens]
MDPLSFAGSVFTVIDLALAISSRPTITRKKYLIGFIQEELPILASLLHETSSIFLNSERLIPESAKYALSLCETRMQKLEHKLLRSGMLKLDEKPKFNSIKMFLGEDRTYNACIAFKEAVLTLREIATMLRYVERLGKYIDTNGFETNQHSPAGKVGSNTAIGPHLQENFIPEYMKQEIEEQQLKADLQNRQLDDTDATLFLIRLLPVLGGIEGRFSAMCKLDTGSEVNLIDEKFVQEGNLTEIVQNIAAGEQTRYKGLGGGEFIPTRKIFLPFTIKRAAKIRTGTFFLYPNLDFNIMISNKFFKAVVDADEAYKQTVALFRGPRMELNPEQEALRKAQLERQQRDHDAAKRARDERRQFLRQQQLSPASFNNLSPMGRAYTLDNISIGSAPQSAVTPFPIDPNEITTHTRQVAQIGRYRGAAANLGRASNAPEEPATSPREMDLPPLSIP